MGLIYWWARIASLAPGLVNAASHAPLLGGAIKALGGIAPERKVPVFASETYREWFARRPRRDPGGAPLLLWPDTFTNHFYPEVGRAAVEVLEDAGFAVEIPEISLCCGRPLYDFGMLDLAKHQLRQILEALHPRIAAGIPLVGLEPSCVTVFRDEMVNLFPQDEDARRLAGQTFLLSELLDERTPGYAPPRLDRKAIVHGHCHHKSVIGMTAEARLLSKMGLDFEILDSGCCGMAGSFGFEADHYDVSIAVGERVLLPAVRRADADTLLIADGFSCRQQIEQTTGRKALHLAEVLRMALREEGAPAVVRAVERDRLPAAAVAASALGGVLFGRSVARRLARSSGRPRRARRRVTRPETW
jgi:Fe-S oxidoreductase